MTGKEKCTLLKKLRKDIADANGIKYEIEECKFKGNCKGTCPKCDAELKELTRKVEEKNKRNGLLGLGIGAVALSLVGCTNLDNIESGITTVEPYDNTGNDVNTVEVQESTSQILQEPLQGVMTYQEAETGDECITLEGDVEYEGVTDETDIGEECMPLEGDVEFDGIIEESDTEREDMDIDRYSGDVEYSPNLGKGSIESFIADILSK